MKSFINSAMLEPADQLIATTTVMILTDYSCMIIIIVITLLIPGKADSLFIVTAHITPNTTASNFIMLIPA